MNVEEPGKLKFEGKIDLSRQLWNDNADTSASHGPRYTALHYC